MSAQTSRSAPTWRRWLPWLILAGLAILVVGRMLYLGSVGDRFNGAFFARAAIDSVKLGSLYALIALPFRRQNPSAHLRRE